MLGAFIAASAIDLEHWIIPLNICWFVTAAGFIGSAVCVYIIDPILIRTYSLLPSASPDTGAMAVGATIGLAISLVLIMSGALKRSYEPEKSEDFQKLRLISKIKKKEEKQKRKLFGKL